MTTLDPGASVVFTHGLLDRPRSTAVLAASAAAVPGARVVFTHGLLDGPRSPAFLASSAAPIITCGLDVLVHEVIAAITTEPWSTDGSVPSSMTTRVRFEGRPETASFS